MSQLKNSDVLEHILVSVIYIITRRTSERYAIVMVGNVIKQLLEKYVFLKNIRIKDTVYSEVVDIVDVNLDINDVAEKEVGRAVGEFIKIV